jgi:regulator of protease activity HflC (stomatin/prohibitin superfamily)
MFRIFDVAQNERAILLRRGRALRALAPGRHYAFGFGLTLEVFDTDALVLRTSPENRALLPKDWYAEVTVAAHQRGVLFKDGWPLTFLRPALHRFWIVDPSVKLELYSVDESMPKLSDELLQVIPSKEYVRVLVREEERGLRYVAGRFVETLGPGQYAFWSGADAPVDVRVVSLRREQLALAGQELLTRDKVSLRLSVTVEYAITDPAAIAGLGGDVKDSIYLLVQLALREYVAGVTLDELLEGRDAMTRYVEQRALAEAERFGVRIQRVGVKDVILPGEMKALLNRVIEAEKAAAANVILRREETAATRSLANTAKVMAENPILLRLKELDAFKEIAAQIDEVRLVVGADGLKTLLPAGLLDRNGN